MPRAGAEQGGSVSPSTTLIGRPSTRRPASLTVEPLRLAGERALAFHLDEDPRLGQGRGLEAVRRG